MAHFEDPTNEYATVHSTEEPEILARLRRATWLNTTKPQMLSDPIQGRFLAMISKMVNPLNILEIGTFSGYSTICLAEGIKKGGSIDTLEINDELEDLQNQFFKEAGLISDDLAQIRCHFGHALDTLKSDKLIGNYDLIWIDADKENQIEYVDLTIDMLNPGGWLLVDNVIWGGAVMDSKKLENPNSGASRIHRLNLHILNHPKLENVLLPIWDGVQVARLK